MSGAVPSTKERVCKQHDELPASLETDKPGNADATIHHGRN